MPQAHCCKNITLLQICHTKFSGVLLALVHTYTMRFSLTKTKDKPMTDTYNTKLTEALKTIRSNGKKYYNKVQKTLIMVIEHASKHGDYENVTRLYKALGGGTRKEAFVVYVKAFTPLNFDKDNQKFKKAGKKSKRTWMVTEAKQVNFWDFTVEAEVKALDIEKLLESIVKRNDKATTEGREVKNIELIPAIQAILTK